MNTTHIVLVRIALGVVLYVIGAGSVGYEPLIAPIFLFTATLLIAGTQLSEIVRLCLACAILVLGDSVLNLALLGFLLIPRLNRAKRPDEAIVGWVIFTVSLVATDTGALFGTPRALLMTAGVFLIGGIWPVTGAWMKDKEGWGRRVGRGIVSIWLLATVLPQACPNEFYAWAPWALFFPIIGVIWSSALAASGAGGKAPLPLLWFFEIQLAAIIILGVRSGIVDILPFAFWAILLPLAVLIAITEMKAHGNCRYARSFGLMAVVSLLALPGLVGFVYRWISIASLLRGSPAGTMGYILGLLALPIFLRPVRARLRDATLTRTTLMACLLVSAAMVILGVAPGLSNGQLRGGAVWDFILSHTKW